MLFQSTLSVRRATNATKPTHQPVHISIHALREESDNVFTQNYIMALISIHALREESDVRKETVFPATYNFNPRSP